MSADDAKDGDCQAWPWWRLSLTGLSVLGLTLSFYLAWHYIAGGSVIGCSGGSPCDQVLGSRWSTIGGVLPVSGLAVGAYLAILLASFYLGSDTEASIRRLAWQAMLVLVGAAAGSAVWFTYVQKWVMGAFCPYCMATHITGLLLAVLVIWQAPKQLADKVSPVAARRLAGRWPANGPALIGVTLAGILAAGQIIFTPASVTHGGESPKYNLPVIDPRSAPLIGSPSAPFVVTLLFDYECPHCQKLHSLLDEVIRHYDGKLAFALCPVPLNPHCNPYIPREVDAFKDSCELTKIALAVWVAQHEAFPDFDRWMYSPELGQPWHPRSIEAARAKAIEMIGQTKFDTAKADPWIARYMQTSIQLYGATGADVVPKLVFGSRWINAEPNDANDLVAILQASVAIPKP